MSVVSYVGFTNKSVRAFGRRARNGFKERTKRSVDSGEKELVRFREVRKPKALESKDSTSNRNSRNYRNKKDIFMGRLEPKEELIEKPIEKEDKRSQTLESNQPVDLKKEPIKIRRSETTTVLSREEVAVSREEGAISREEPVYPIKDYRTLEELDALDDEENESISDEELLRWIHEPDEEPISNQEKLVSNQKIKEPEIIPVQTKKPIEVEKPQSQPQSMRSSSSGTIFSGPPSKKKPKKKKKKLKYRFPPIEYLQDRKNTSLASDASLRKVADELEETFHSFGVGVHVTEISCGPTVTRYELLPDQGVKVSKILSLTNDIKLRLAAADIRIEAPIPGKSAIGIEVPNSENQIVSFKELITNPAFRKHPSRLAFAVGKDISGKIIVTDLAKTPHLLIAGATGSGKSVCINTLIMSILYKSKPEDVKFLMIDPKVVELSIYNGIPHLLIPVVTDARKAANALNWAVAEMDDRYRKMADYGVRDLKSYNRKIEEENMYLPEEEKKEKIPQMVIIVDELADLMMVAASEVETAICRLAQKARAADMHLVLATQRPSVNVITGVIKANVPSRMAFAVSSGVDSRTIIDMNGAEKLLGKGDMLYAPAWLPKPIRVQSAFVSDEEVAKVVDFLAAGNEYVVDQVEQEELEKNVVETVASSMQQASERDDYFEQAARFVIEKDKGSIGMLQRAFRVGFNRAARIMEQLEVAGIVGAEEGTKPRKILMTLEELEEYLQN
ncbi:Cell division protein FtsK [Lachnospiraceae bacterium TWA4]|nr:Cell division protein FtsK [Lachnospiraceae bacterium TWA4]